MKSYILNRMLKKSTILVTGCNGYIGSCISAFINKNYFLVGIDKKKLIPKSNNLGIEYNINLNNFSLLKNVISKHQIDCIIHLAGESTLDNIKNKYAYYLNNVLATKNLINIAKHYNINNIIFASTAAVYADQLKFLTERSIVKPNNIYGKTKLTCENLIKKEFSKKNKSYIIFRFFNVCGSYFDKRVGELHNPETHLIPILVNKALKNKNFKVYGNNYKTKDGTCIRDYIHVKDLCIALKKALSLIKKKTTRQVFNLGTRRGFSVMEIIKQVELHCKCKLNISFKKKRKCDISKLVCIPAKIEKYLKWKPRFSKISKIIADEFKWQLYLKKKKIKIKTIY